MREGYVEVAVGFVVLVEAVEGGLADLIRVYLQEVGQEEHALDLIVVFTNDLQDVLEDEVVGVAPLLVSLLHQA